MSISYFWLLYVHIIASSLLVGSMLFFSVLFRNIKKRLSKEEFAGEIVSILRFYHPFILLCMGTLIMTGAWYLTGLKISMGPSFSKLFVPLGSKLLSVFFLVIGMCFQFFAIGLRLTRGIGPAGNGQTISSTAEERLKLLNTLENVNAVNVVIGMVTIFLGLGLTKGF